MTGETKEVISAVKEMFSVLNSKMDAMNTRMDTMDERLVKIETTQETGIKKDRQLLVEGYSAMSEKLGKLDTLSEDMENVKMDVDVIKEAVETNFEEHTVLAKVATAK